MKKLLSVMAGFLGISNAAGSLVACNTPPIIDPNSDELYAFLKEMETFENNKNSTIMFKDVTHDQMSSVNSVQKYISDTYLKNTLQLEKFHNRFIIDMDKANITPIKKVGNIFAQGSVLFKVKDHQTNKFITFGVNNEQTFGLKFITCDVSNVNNIASNLQMLNKEKSMQMDSLSVYNLLDSFTSVFGFDFKGVIANWISQNPAIGTILEGFLNQPLSQLISMVKTMLPSIIDVSVQLPFIIPTNPQFDKTGMLQDQTWQTFYDALQTKIGTMAGSDFKFSDIKIPAIEKKLSKKWSFLQGDLIIRLNESNLGILINSIAPDIMHFINFCWSISNDGDYTLDVIKYFLNSPRTIFENVKDNMDKVNVDMVDSGQIKTNLDNLFFDLLGNKQIDNKVVGWHGNKDSTSGAQVPLIFSLEADVSADLKWWTPKWSSKIEFGYVNTIGAILGSSTIVTEPLMNISEVAKKFISNLFFSETADSENLINNKINLFDYVNLRTIAELILGDHWFIKESWYDDLANEIKKTISDKLKEQFNFDAENISTGYFYKSILNDFLVQQNDSSVLKDYQLNINQIDGELLTSKDNKTFNKIDNIDQLINPNTYYWKFNLTEMIGMYKYLGADDSLNLNFDLQNIAFKFL